MKILPIAFVLLAACGVENPQNGGETQVNFAEQGGVEHAKNDKEIVTEYRKEAGRMAVSLAETKDLPQCNNANFNQLAYVRSEKKFFECVSGVWGEIIIGTEGPKGEKGEPGPPAPAPSINAWRDPISGSEWVIGGMVRVGVIQSASPCSGEYRLPSEAELVVGLSHGLSAAANRLGQYVGFWTSDYKPHDVSGEIVMLPVGYAVTGDEIYTVRTAILGAACLKK